MNKLNSPLAWVGGKSRLRDSIIPLIPKHHCYVEVFAGAAWVYPPSKVEVLNDINGDLVNLYRTLQRDPEAFYDALWYMFPSRQLHKMSKELLADPNSPLSDVERAVLFYYQIKYAFGARYGAGYALSAIRPPRQLIGMDLLTGIRDRLANTHVENLSFDRIIPTYDRDSTFFYCDPPYVVADGGDYYQYTFDEAPAREIKGHFLLSYDDLPITHKLYKDFKIRKTKDIRYTLNNRTGKVPRKHELLVSNY